uniref:Uncharacterized protein n=1 Tax=Aegilops tauschii subsp. strangulata TaxID=200361 RepID=A0A453L072_AEGTS
MNMPLQLIEGQFIQAGPRRAAGSSADVSCRSAAFYLLSVVSALRAAGLSDPAAVERLAL